MQEPSGAQPPASSTAAPSNAAGPSSAAEASSTAAASRRTVLSSGTVVSSGEVVSTGAVASTVALTSTTATTSSGAATASALAAAAAMPVEYVGLVTRAIAFALDAAVIIGVAIVVEVGAALILSIVHVASDLKPLLITIGAVAYALWGLGYFVAFWSGTGQTPGCRVMQIRVVTANGLPIKPARAVVRCIGLLLAALPLFAGYVIIPFNDKRRGLMDYMARTVVVEAPALSVADVKRAQSRAAHPMAPDLGRGRNREASKPAGSYDSGDDPGQARVQA